MFNRSAKSKLFDSPIRQALRENRDEVITATTRSTFKHGGKETLADAMAEVAETMSPENCQRFYETFTSLPPEQVCKLAATLAATYTEFVQYIAILQDSLAALTNPEFSRLSDEDQAQYRALRRSMVTLFQEQMKRVFDTVGKQVMDQIFKGEEYANVPPSYILHEYLHPSADKHKQPAEPADDHLSAPASGTHATPDGRRAGTTAGVGRQRPTLSLRWRSAQRPPDDTRV